MTSPAPRTLAIISAHMTPYRVALHRRIAAGIPELPLRTLVTRHRSGPWTNPDVPEIGTVMLHGDDGARSPEPLSRGAFFRREWRTSGNVIRWLNQHTPAAILSIGYDEFPNIRALRWAARRGVPSFIWADSNAMGDGATGLRRIVKNIYVPWVLRPLSGVMVCGVMGRRFFARYGAPEQRMFTMPVDPDYAPLERAPDPAATRSLGLAAGRKRLLVCSRLVWEKRVSLAITAFAAIAADRPDWDLVIAGDGLERATLEASVPAELTRTGRVRFLGFLNGEAVASLYRQSQVLVLPSDYEPWALVVIEAAVSGMAIVSSDRVGAAYELVRQGENGVMFPAGDAAALIRTLLEVTTPGRAEEMGRVSRTVVAEWREKADPVAGLRQALAHAGVL